MDFLRALEFLSNMILRGGNAFDRLLTVGGIYMGPVPQGKGIFISNAPGGGSPAQVIQICKDANVSFVAIGVSSNKLAEYTSALKSAGIQVWIWGWPEDGREVAFADQMVAKAKAVGAVGIIPDPEAPYQNNPVAAENLAKQLKKKIGDLGLGITSFGHAYLQGRFPWSKLGGLGFGCPQIYSYPGRSNARALQSWYDYGWRELVAAIPVWTDSEHPITPAGLVSLLDDCKRAGCKGIIAWNLFHKANYPELWETFANYRW